MSGTRRRGRVLGTAVLTVAASATLALSLASCTRNPAPAAGSGSGGGTATTAGATAGVVGSPVPADSIVSSASRPPVAGVDGDQYARNVVPGAVCSPAGKVGFTARVQPMHCTTTAADPHLHWRAP